MTRWVVRGVIAAANLCLYLVFTWDRGSRELIAGGLVAILATSAAIRVAMADGERFVIRPRDLAQAWRIPWELLTDSVMILQALALQLVARRRMPGVLAAVAFDVGDARAAGDAGRRALAETYPSATPNAIMLGIVEGQDLMLYHQLVPGPLSPMLRQLGAVP